MNKRFLAIFLFLAIVTSCFVSCNLEEIPSVLVPVSSFTVTNNGCTAPCEVIFTNTSTNASSYLWDFGDGTPPVTTASPAHTFQIGGTFSVKLTAIGSGDSVQTSQTVNVATIKFEKHDASVAYTALWIDGDNYYVAGSTGLGLSGITSTWKFSKAGVVLATQQYPTFSQFPFIRSLIAGNNNTFVLGGSFGSGSFFSDPFAQSFRSDLTSAWGVEYSFEPCAEIYDVAKAPDGYMLAGYQGDCDQGTYASLLIKTNINGAFLFSKSLSGLDNIPAIESLSDGYLISYVGGFAKIDFNGTVLQSFALPTGQATSILTVSDGYLMVAGSQIHKVSSTFSVLSSGAIPTVGFGVPGGEVIAQAHDGGYVVVLVKSTQLKLVKLSSSFAVVWEAVFNGTYNASGTQSHYVVKATPDGGFAIVGYGAGLFIKTDPLGKVN